MPPLALALGQPLQALFARSGDPSSPPRPERGAVVSAESPDAVEFAIILQLGMPPRSF